MDNLNITSTIIEDSLHFERLKTGGIDIWAMVETAKGVANAVDIAAHSSVEALVLGCNDLTKDLKTKFSRGRLPLYYSMSACVVAARAAKKLVIDGVYMDTLNSEGLSAGKNPATANDPSRKAADTHTTKPTTRALPSHPSSPYRLLIRKGVRVRRKISYPPWSNHDNKWYFFTKSG